MTTTLYFMRTEEAMKLVDEKYRDNERIFEKFLIFPIRRPFRRRYLINICI